MRAANAAAPLGRPPAAGESEAQRGRRNEQRRRVSNQQRCGIVAPLHETP
jgi:hypothetical protein